LSGVEFKQQTNKHLITGDREKRRGSNH
jgi:hypothetical protein